MKARIEFEKIVNYPIIPPNVPRCPEWPNFVGKGLEKRSPEEQAVFGFKTVAEPEITNAQYYSDVLEDGDGGFVYEIKDIIQPTLEEIRAQLFNQLDAHADRFTHIISKCNLINEIQPEGLILAIRKARLLLLATRTKIQNFTLEQALAYEFNQQIITDLEQEFKPFM